MARLPTREDLGAPPSARSGRPIARVDTTAIGKGAAALGQSAVRLGAALAKRAEEGDPNERFDVARRLIEFETAEEARAREAESNITGDGTGFANSVVGTYDAGADAVVDRARTEGLSERGLQTLNLGLMRARSQIYNRAHTQELAAREAHHLEETTRTLRTLTDRTVADPGRLARSMREGYALIDASRLSPAAKVREREQFRLAIQRAEVEQRIRTATTLEEREAILNDLRTLRRPHRRGDERPDTSAAIPEPPEGWSLKPEALGRANYATEKTFGAPGQDLTTVTAPNGARFRVNKRVAGNFQGFLNELASRGYNISSSGGYANRPIRGSARTSQHAFGNAVDIGAGANALGSRESDLPEDVAEIAAKHGLTWGGNWDRPDPMHFEFHAAHGVPMRGLDDIKGATARDVADAGAGAGAGGETREEGTDDAFIFSDNPRYDLSAAERLTLIRNIRTHFRASILQPLRNGLEAIINGEQPETDAQGQTALDYARRFMTKKQIGEWEQRWRKAQALNDATANIHRLPHHRLGGYVEGLPSNIRDVVRRRARRLLELYDTDPARAVGGGVLQGRDRMPPVSVDPATGMPSVREVTGDEDVRLPAHPSVREAYRLMDHVRPLMTPATDAEGNTVLVPAPGAEEKAAQEKWRIIIEGRLAAQRERGVPEKRLSPITKEEAGRLLAFPPNASSMTPEDFERTMKEAIDRAYATYGPYARMALDAALRLRGNLSRTNADTAQYLMRSMIDGTPLDANEMRSLWQRMQLDTEEMAWLGGRPGSVSGIGPTGIAEVPPWRLAPEPVRPPPEEPGFFDRMFGGGTPEGPQGPAPVTGPSTVPTTQPTGVPGVSTQQWPDPDPRHVEALLRHPAEMQNEFDATYGPGTASLYLQGLAPPTRRSNQ